MWQQLLDIRMYMHPIYLKQVSCCLMEPGRKGYVRSSPLYDVDLNKTDSYEVVISKICRSIGEEMSDNFRIFNAKGAIIPNQKIALRDKEVNWTLGGYLQKRHTSPDKITLGIGMLEDEPQPKRVKGISIYNYMYLH